MILEDSMLSKNNPVTKSTVFFHSCKLSEVVKFLETECTMVVTGGWWEEEKGNCLLIDIKLYDEKVLQNSLPAT